MTDLTVVAVGKRTRPTREWRNGDLVICKKAGDFFNMEGVIKATIMERRGPSLDVLMNGERVILATKWWWSVTKISSSNEEEEKISTSDAPDGSAIGAECGEEGEVSLSSDTSLESSENSM